MDIKLKHARYNYCITFMKKGYLDMPCHDKFGSPFFLSPPPPLALVFLKYGPPCMHLINNSRDSEDGLGSVYKWLAGLVFRVCMGGQISRDSSPLSPFVLTSCPVRAQYGLTVLIFRFWQAYTHEPFFPY